ncbi:MAG TPA: DMT family transporter [Alphaproteobacteria bacterium]
MTDRLRPNRARGLLLMVAAGLCWSTGGILVRNVSVTNGWEIVFWRSLFMVLSLTAILFVWHGRRTFAKFAAVGRWGIVTGFFLSLTFFFFILSVTRTTVANTLVIMSLSPFVAALFGWLLLREPVPARTWMTMAVGIAGMVLMFADSLEHGGLLGNLLALGVPLAFTANLVALRRHAADIDMVPTVVIAGIISLPLALPFAPPFTATVQDIAVLALMGTVQLGLGCMLMTLATRHLSAAEIGLLALLETTLGPIWVWLGIGERPTDLALMGGLIVIGSLAINALLGLAQEKRRAPAE